MLVYLIGGGPSAGSLETSRLIGGLRIGINDAAFHKPVDAFFSNDHNYVLGIKEQIYAFHGAVHLAVRHRNIHRFDGWPVKIWRRTDGEPAMDGEMLSSGPHGTPGCSGYVGLNLAAALGATKIVLFGYDFHDTYRYFFSPDPFPRLKVRQVVESFSVVAPWYRRRGIQIFNANPESAITAFPRITHDEALLIHEGRHSDEPARGEPRLSVARKLRRGAGQARLERRA